MGVICWRDIIDMLWSVSMALNFIHEHNLIHGHLHGGNILIECEMDSIDAKMADTGLHGPVDRQMSSSPQTYGVIPFAAPEIFSGNIPTKASDVYSFGMIMWMLSAGTRPYHDKPHDRQLIQDICSGLRPSVINGTPDIYAGLMLQCLDTNPSNRPTASQLYECLGNWASAIDDLSELSVQFGAADLFKIFNPANLENLSYHEKAIYYSRPLDSINIESSIQLFYGKT